MDTHGPREMRVVTPNSPGMLRGLCGIPAVKHLAECLTHSGSAGHIRLLPQSQSSLQASPGPDENISFTHTLRCWRAPGKLYLTWVLCLLILLGMNECSEVEGYVEFYLLLKKKKKNNFVKHPIFVLSFADQTFGLCRSGGPQPLGCPELAEFGPLFTNSCQGRAERSLPGLVIFSSFIFTGRETEARVIATWQGHARSRW